MSTIKKTIILILCLTFLLALTACGGKKPASKPSSEESLPVAKFNVEDFTWNGSRKILAIFPSEDQLGLGMLLDSLDTTMQDYGIATDVVYAENDVYKQESYIKEAVAEGEVGGIVLVPLSTKILEGAVAQAMNAGIAVIMIGGVPEGYKVNGCLYSAYELTGAWAVEAAQLWLDSRTKEGGKIPKDKDGKVEAACDIYTEIKDGIYCANALKDTIENSKTLKAVSYTELFATSDPEKSGYNSAKEILETNPDCRVFIAYRPETAVGYNKYIKEYAKDKKLDLADFCVVSCYAENTEFGDEYEAAKADHSASAVKAYSTHGDRFEYDETGAFILPLMKKGIEVGEMFLGSFNANGYSWEAGTVVYDDVWAQTVYGDTLVWRDGDENPAEKYKTTDLTKYLNEE